MLLGIATGAKLNPNKDLQHDLDLIGGAGAQAVRRYISWEGVEPTMGSGIYDWSREDEVFGAVKGRGLKMLMGISARMDGRALDADHLGPFGNFAEAAAARYGYDAHVLGFEGPNELMLGTKYDTMPTGARYAAMQHEFYAAVKTGCPSALCGTGSFIGRYEFLAECYEAGMRGDFDFVAWHPYTHPLSPLQSMRQSLAGWWGMMKAREIMRTNGDGHKQIWITEYGSNTAGSDARSEDEQAYDLYDAVTIFRRHPWAGNFFWFTGWDDANPGNHPGESMGLYQADGTPKRARDQFARLAVASALEADDA